MTVTGSDQRKFLRKLEVNDEEELGFSCGDMLVDDEHGGRSERRAVHRLVLMAFVGPETKPMF